MSKMQFTEDGKSELNRLNLRKSEFYDRYIQQHDTKGDLKAAYEAARSRGVSTRRFLKLVGIINSQQIALPDGSVLRLEPNVHMVEIKSSRRTQRKVAPLTDDANVERDADPEGLERVALRNREQRAPDTMNQVASASRSVDLLSEIPANVLCHDTKPLLLKKLKERCAIRIVALDPRGDALKSMVVTNRTYAHRARKGSVEQALNAARAQLQECIAIYDELNEAAPDDQIQMRVFDGPVTYGMLLTDRDDNERGLARIELRLYGADAHERPNFYLRPSSQCYWYAAIARQFEEVWNSPSIIDVKRLS